VTGPFERRVVPRLAQMGHLPAPYISFRTGSDPFSGIDFGNSLPRFSTGYAPLQCRPAILVETHMLKPYGNRVRATYDLLVALLEDLGAHPGELVDAVEAAESDVIARGGERDPARREVTLDTRLSERSVPFDYKGIAMRLEPSDISGVPVARYSGAPWDSVVPLYREVTPTLTVRQPVGYLVPQEWTVCRDHLDLHGVRYRRFTKVWSDTVEVQRVLEWNWGARPDQGHRPVTVARVALERRLRSFRPGDLWVPLDQRSAMVAVHLFEARGPDGLMYWNAFDSVLEFKEYSEDYVMEPIARKMLAADTALAREFRSRIAADTAFANNPAARLDFLYRRSPWADPEQNVHPVARALRAPPDAVLAP
jgi:hypothetical protein